MDFSKLNRYVPLKSYPISFPFQLAVQLLFVLPKSNQKVAFVHLALSGRF